MTPKSKQDGARRRMFGQRRRYAALNPAEKTALLEAQFGRPKKPLPETKAR